MAEACIGIGSNQENPEQQVRQALNELDTLSETSLVKQSSFYRTEPWGVKNQPSFINAVALIHTELSPDTLLKHLQKIEHQAGRVREKKWGPRVLDLDIICYEDLEMQTPDLILPHPYFSERAFVLEPLVEIYPNYPLLGKPASDWLDQFNKTA